VVRGNHQRSHHPDPCVAGETSAGLAVVAKGDKDSAYGWKSEVQIGVQWRGRALAGNQGADML
jgi:hypothetical protein